MSISPKRLEELQNIPDSDIDTSDIPELDDNFWKNAKVVKSALTEKLRPRNGEKLMELVGIVENASKDASLSQD